MSDSKVGTWVYKKDGKWPRLPERERFVLLKMKVDEESGFPPFMVGVVPTVIPIRNVKNTEGKFYYLERYGIGDSHPFNEKVIAFFEFPGK